MNDIVTVEGIKAYVDTNGITHIKLRDCAIGIGLAEVRIQNGKEYTKVRWARLREYLRQINVAPTLAQSPSDATLTNEQIKESFISEPDFYLLAMKVDTKPALDFRNKLAFDILPKIRRQGYYIAQDKAVDFIELCNVEYEAAKPDQRKFTNAVKVLIEYAVSGGVDRSTIDPAYYKFTNAHINRALGIDNGLRPFANPTTTVHCRNLHKIIKRLIRSGIENNHHHTLILEDVLDAIDDYGTEHIDAEERARNNTFAKAHKQHDKERRAIERANRKLALEQAKLPPDPDYDIDDDDDDDEDKDFITEV